MFYIRLSSALRCSSFCVGLIPARRCENRKLQVFERAAGPAGDKRAELSLFLCLCKLKASPVLLVMAPRCARRAEVLSRNDGGPPGPRQVVKFFCGF